MFLIGGREMDLLLSNQYYLDRISIKLTGILLLNETEGLITSHPLVQLYYVKRQIGSTLKGGLAKKVVLGCTTMFQPLYISC